MNNENDPEGRNVEILGVEDIINNQTTCEGFCGIFYLLMLEPGLNAWEM